MIIIQNREIYVDFFLLTKAISSDLSYISDLNRRGTIPEINEIFYLIQFI